MKTSMKDPGTRAVIKAAFPDYRGRKVRIDVRERNVMATTWWDGGSKDDVAAVRLVDMKPCEIPSTSPYDNQGLAMAIYHEGIPMCEGIAIVVHSIFCGKDAGITIYLHPDNAAKLLESG